VGAAYKEMLTDLFIHYYIASVRGPVIDGVICAGGQPDYRCQVLTGVLINETLPGTDNGSSVKCEVNVGNNETEQCTDWEYFGDVGHTIVSQVNRATAVT